MDNSYGLAELHEQLLLIMDDIDRVCRAHDIKYTLSDGSLLGAIRHKGFIPWDDDMDVRMVRSEFEKFKEVYAKEKKEDFVIGHPCNLATYSVINPNYDIPGMEKRGYAIINPWISIFPMDIAPQNAIVSKVKATKMRVLSGMMGKPPQYSIFSYKAKRLWDITSFFGGLTGRERVNEWFYNSCTSLNENETGYYSSYTSNSKWIYVRYPSEIFKDIMDIEFEDRTYMGIARYDAYLTLVYGNYMIPVPPKEREPKHMRKEMGKQNV